MTVERTDARRERDRLRQQVRRLHLKGDHSRCRENCTEPYDFTLPGAIPLPRDCKAGPLSFIRPGTITREEYYRRGLDTVERIRPIPTFISQNGGSCPIGLALNDAAENPEPPALAYHCVVQAIADHTWFHKPQPEAGSRLLVTGFDQQTTQWDMDTAHAVLVVRRLRLDNRVRHISVHPYDHAAERAA